MNCSFLQRGEGKDLVMLHGYLASKESFYPLIDYFSRFYRVTAPDFPGMGASDALTEPYSVSDYADWTERFLAERGIVFPNVIAHSFGGRVAIKLLSRGEIFDRTVLTGCAGIVPKRGPVYRLKVKTYRAVRAVAPAFAERHFGSRDYRGLSPVMKESFKKIVSEDLRQDAAKITRPLLFLNGSEDRETPLSSVRLLHDAAKGSRLSVLEGCGHFAYLDNSLAFRLAVEDFYHADP